MTGQWEVKAMHGNFRVIHSRTQDSAGQTWTVEEDAQTEADRLNAAAAKIRADILARSRAGAAKQAEIDAIRPERMLSNGADW